MAMAFEVGRGEVGFLDVDIDFAEDQAGIERGQHAVTRVDGNATGTDVDVVNPALGQHLVQHCVGHNTAAGVCVANNQNVAIWFLLHGYFTVVRKGEWGEVKTSPPPSFASSCPSPHP
jgi:hypothetical protein